MVLTGSLAQQNEIDEFVRTRSDREIAVTGLTLAAHHIESCDRRWASINRWLRIIALMIVGLFVMKIGESLHVDLSPLLQLL